MRRIKFNVDPKDRIVCVKSLDELKFYYRPFGSKLRIALFEDEVVPFSESVTDFFRSKGSREGGGYSLTLKQLYQEKPQYRKPRIAKLFDRLPGMIEHAFSVQLVQEKPSNSNKKVKNAMRVA